MACSPETPTQPAERGERLTFGYTAPADLPTTPTNPFAGTPTAPHAGSGYFDSNGSGPGDIFACRDCSYTNLDDLGTGLRGHEQIRNVDATLTTELTAYANGLWSYGTNGGLKGRMLAAEPLINDSFGGSYASELFDTIEDIKVVMELFPGAAGKLSVTQPAAKTWTIAFKPIQARAKTAVLPTNFSFQPVLLRQTRFRGARSYCAMRQAAREQRSTGDTLVSLGGQALGSWWLWDYGEGETTVEIAGPIQVGRVPGEPEVTSTGANAFVIPISVGARVTPLYGAPFPKMPEITHPLVWVTGDAEVIWWDGVAQYTNVQHADFWTGQYVEGAGITIDDLVLFSFGGIVDVIASGGLEMTMGKPVNGLCGSGVHSKLADGRGLYQTGTATCSTNPGYMRRSNEWDPLNAAGTARVPSEYASDAPLGVRGTGTFNFFPVEGTAYHTPWAAVLPFAWGINERWLANDDRSVVLEDSVEEWLSLGVDAHLSIGALELGIQGASTLSVETTQLTTVRDHLSVVNGDYTLPYAYSWPNSSGNSILPQTNFVVTSETSNTFSFDPLTLTAYYSMEIDIEWIGTFEVHWQHEFFSVADLSSTIPGTPAPEHRRLRVGQYSDWGNDFVEEGSTGRVVMSHLPSPSDPPHFFASFPDASSGDPRDVPSCLADNSVEDDPPEEDPSIPPPTPSSEICWYGPTSPCFSGDIQCGLTADFCVGFNGWQLPSNVCQPAPMAQWLSQFQDEEYDCFATMLAYLCGGTHLQQNWGQDGSVVARVFHPVNDAAAVFGVFAQCVGPLIKAQNPVDEAEAQCLADRFGQYMKAAPCTTSAVLTGTPP